MNRLYLWHKLGIAGAASGLVVSAYLYSTGGGAGPADYFTYLLITIFAAWAGALAGGLLDWARYRRSPLEPLFEGRFNWFYRQRYWLRMAMMFGGGWTAFVALAVSVALGVGAKEEAAPFYSPKGLLLVLVFVVVFALEGAVVGGAIDLVRFLARKHTKKP